MKIIKYVVFLFVIFPIIAFSSGLPPAPPGFSWHSSSNGVGTFLKPESWFVLEEKKGNTNALFISREDIKEKGRFTVGFSVNQITSYSDNATGKPSLYAKGFIQKIIDKEGYEVLKKGVVKGGPSDMNIARVKGDNSGVKTIVHHIAIGMDDRDELYLISFEAPESEWEAYYDKAGPMLNFLLLGS
jgi:hypothetical protein